MPITRPHTIGLTGAATGYHVVKRLDADLVAGTLMVTVLNYVSKAAFDAGALPVWSTPVSIPLPAIAPTLAAAFENWLLNDPSTPLT